MVSTFPVVASTLSSTSLLLAMGDGWKGGVHKSSQGDGNGDGDGDGNGNSDGSTPIQSLLWWGT